MLINYHLLYELSGRPICRRRRRQQRQPKQGAQAQSKSRGGPHHAGKKTQTANKLIFADAASRLELRMDASHSPLSFRRKLGTCLQLHVPAACVPICIHGQDSIQVRRVDTNQNFT